MVAYTPSCPAECEPGEKYDVFENKLQAQRKEWTDFYNGLSKEDRKDYSKQTPSTYFGICCNVPS